MIKDSFEIKKEGDGNKEKASVVELLRDFAQMLGDS